MFSSPEIAHNLTWHARGRVNNGKLTHPLDYPAWKLVDNTWKEFGEEDRSIRFALSADGIKPHKSLSSTYSCKPVILITFNLPSYLCMSRKFMMLNLLISWPNQPSNNIDVYLAPLTEDLKLLWETGVKIFDAYKKIYFNLRALLVRHQLEVMHIEKNVCESVYGTLLNLPHKKKEGLSTRQDLEELGIKPELQTQLKGDRLFLRPACYTLNTIEKHLFYDTLSNLKVSDGYFSNFKNIVSDDDSKMNGLKSNDCHVLMQQLLQFAIKEVLHEKVEKRLANGEDISDSVRWLAKGPKGLDILLINIVIASANDSNPVNGVVTYFGRINEIWDHDYHMFTVPVFMCDWDDSRRVKNDDFGFTAVNFERLGHQSEHFILASQARQVFYVQDQQDDKLSVVGFTPHKMYKYGATAETDDMLEFEATANVTQDTALVDLDEVFCVHAQMLMAY
ncbi:uncharacterized protein LOC143598346 [Bidens hawaiensis]|uniref:uncharacterized protein LOC143598346 n=1 Tax=Bidens hawaiensis TaxID=980011 RepID=UPI00404ACCF4